MRSFPRYNFDSARRPQTACRKAGVLQQMLVDLTAQLDAERARRIKTEHLLQQLLQPKAGAEANS